MVGELGDDLDLLPIPERLPVLPLAEVVVVPRGVAPVPVSRPRDSHLVDDTARGDRIVALVAQRHATSGDPSPEDLYRVGCTGFLHQIFRGPDGTLRIVVQGIARIRLGEFEQLDPYLVARVAAHPEVTGHAFQASALMRVVRALFERLVALSPHIPDELGSAAHTLEDPRQLAYLVSSSTPLSMQARQELLELDPVTAKLDRLIELLQHELALRELERKIASATRETLTRSQKEMFLREHLKSIQRELGDEEEEGGGVGELAERLVRAPLSEEARREADRELARLRHIPPISPEHGLVRGYLEWMAALPWGRLTGGPIEVHRAREVLDEDHYDLEKVKCRILEHLAVKKLREERSANGSPESPTVPGSPQGEGREPLLCFVGPPGVGKTSLGQSIARSMGRRFVRVSLGGVHDEAEIRGHRRTYIGAMPGRVLQALRRVEVADPVFMLDEVDKLGAGFHGDPSAALLEVLDPAQNQTFVDNYLGVAFDLSQVLFICTANTVETIPAPLLDRMELIPLAGYTEEEKLHIARRYLFPKQLAAQGLREGEVVIADAALRRLVREYTREAGVRNLERELAAVLRKSARRITEGAQPPLRVDAAELGELLGPQRFFEEVAERLDRPGVATGVAWTPAGGDLLFVEAAMMPGSEEKLVVTGMLGDVMRESAQAALSWVRSNAERLGIDPTAFDRRVVHLHVPAGAIRKDGPSAGVTMALALASLAGCRAVRNDVAMTGEITLRGKVLPVGGIKEKALAAHRAGVRHLILPRRNEAALEDVPSEVREAMRFHLVDVMDEVVEAALLPDSETVSPPVEESAGPTVH